MLDVLPTTIEDLSAEWLSDALRRGGTLAEGEQVEFGAITPLAAGSAFSTKLYRIALVGPSGAPSSVIAKLPVTTPVRGLLDGMGMYAREITFYRDLADEVPVRVPRVYVAEMAADSTDMVLVIEDLAPVVSADQLTGLSLEQAQIAVDGLARLHGWSWGSADLDRLADRFPPLDSPTGRAVAEQYGQFFAAGWEVALRAPGLTLTDEVRAFCERLPSLISFFVDELAEPAALVHGELRADNLCFDPAGGLILLDFQLVQQHAGAVELGYLISQSVATSVRRGHDRALVQRYWEALPEAITTNYPLERAWDQYRLGIAWTLVFPILACMTFDQADERGRRLLVEMVNRAGAAIVDNACLDLVPSR